MSTDIITELRGSKSSGIDPIQKSLLQVRGELYKAEQTIEELKDEVKEVTEVAREKSDELSDTIARIRAYEKGNNKKHYCLATA